MGAEAKSPEQKVKFMKKRTQKKYLAQSKTADAEMRVITEKLAEQIDHYDRVLGKPGENFFVVTDDKSWNQTPICYNPLDQ